MNMCVCVIPCDELMSCLMCPSPFELPVFVTQFTWIEINEHLIYI